uniref:G_PROTEIN_RECEP_F1_2 domain-containing protein n=1 Tax=Panagrellus redivivus TaxID=6233 RepID=A0A7E4V5C5_PANRE
MLADEKLVPICIIFLLSIVGIFGNTRVALAAWSLRRKSTCHWLIFARAILDIVHQTGHFVTVFQIFSGMDTMVRKTCFIIEFLPFSAVIGTSVMTLAIGIDRFLGFYMPLLYRKLKVTVYISTVYLLTTVFAVMFMLLFLFTIENMNEETLCMVGTVVSKAYMFHFFYVMTAIYVLTMLQYVSIWVTSFKRRKELPGYMLRIP